MNALTETQQFKYALTETQQSKYSFPLSINIDKLDINKQNIQTYRKLFDDMVRVLSKSNEEYQTDENNNNRFILAQFMCNLINNIHLFFSHFGIGSLPIVDDVEQNKYIKKNNEELLEKFKSGLKDSIDKLLKGVVIETKTDEFIECKILSTLINFL
jgi:tyrosine-protein phosphatase YwqE